MKKTKEELIIDLLDIVNRGGYTYEVKEGSIEVKDLETIILTIQL